MLYPLVFASGALASTFLSALRREGRPPGSSKPARDDDAVVFGPLLYERTTPALTLYASAGALQLAEGLGIDMPQVMEPVDPGNLPEDAARLYLSPAG